jgi:hypothetical protein
MSSIRYVICRAGGGRCGRHACADPPDIWGPPDAAGIRYAAASIATDHPLFRHWAKPVVVTIRDRNGVLDIVGIDRPTEFPDTVTRRANK